MPMWDCVDEDHICMLFPIHNIMELRHGMYICIYACILLCVWDVCMYVCIYMYMFVFSKLHVVT